jgi:BON domain
MAKREREPRPDFDREVNRPGPDYDRLGPADESPHSSRSADWSDLERRSEFGGWSPEPISRREWANFGDGEFPSEYPRFRNTQPRSKSWIPNYRYGYGGYDDLRWRRGPHVGRGPKGYRRTDDQIREDVSLRLTYDPDVDASGLEVRVSNGVVSLTGDVTDRHQKRLAEMIADDVLGVEDVENGLKVRRARKDKP